MAGINRGDIWMVNLNDFVGSEQNGERPAVIIQNDIGNRYAPTTIIACITDIKKAHLPVHVRVPPGHGVVKPSVVLAEQIRTVDKTRLLRKVGRMSPEAMEEVRNKLMVSLNL